MTNKGKEVAFLIKKIIGKIIEVFKPRKPAYVRVWIN